jgi:hypothetical protein
MTMGYFSLIALIVDISGRNLLVERAQIVPKVRLEIGDLRLQIDDCRIEITE